MKKYFQFAAVLMGITLLFGCGFHLRSGPSLPDNINTVAIESARAHAPLARALDKHLNVYGLNAVDKDSQVASNSVHIYLLPEKLDRQLLSVYPSGQVAEYELIYVVRYRVQFPGKEALMAQFEVVRDYQDDPDQVLAKSRELDLMLNEMRDEAADIIIRRLSSQAVSAQAISAVDAK
ncbi:LPS exporter LptE [Alteromonas sp. D210916BOD_24]|uniref:LPS-assembly lipoprotein LptE n=1 Tax=Alteromonas sp. D210916BOD_24 TaxID=3157618 RepID=UPI00399CBB1C